MTVIKSMTGSANTVLNTEVATITIDLNSVNGRFLEINFKLPDTLKHLEQKLRAIGQEKLARGKVDCYINISLNSSSLLNIDNEALVSLAASINTIQENIPHANVNALEILNFPGIIKQSSNIQEIIDRELLNNFGKALDKLSEARESEGQKLKEALTVRLNLISKQADIIEQQLKDLVLNERNRILNKIAEMKVEVDPARIDQEVAIAAQKADVEEEYDRLRSHIREVTKILDKGGVCGKRLDFMMQEFNRESNTLASKASNLEITQIAVELKVLIEQMREQIQNIE
ncbi:MAG: YicC family protein [Aeromonadales bacterium]|nr:YicC family protein [Aeromonadales bacterium]